MPNVALSRMRPAVLPQPHEIPINATPALGDAGQN